MAQQVQVFHNLIQVFHQIPTLTSSRGFGLFSWLDLNKRGGQLRTAFQTVVCLLILLMAIFALLKCFMHWVTKNPASVQHLHCPNSAYDL